MRKNLLVGLAAAWGLAFAGSAPVLGAQEFTAGFQGVFADLLGDPGSDYEVGTGFGLWGEIPVGPVLSLRGDWGMRWLEGESRLLSDRREKPDLGGTPGTRVDGLRIAPSTLDLVCRLEGWSRGRYWVPYLGAGFGFYDLRARFRTPEGMEIYHNLFKPGWNVRAGVELHRTSGLQVRLETALHLMDLPEHWTSAYEVGVGLGSLLPRR